MLEGDHLDSQSIDLDGLRDRLMCLIPYNFSNNVNWKNSIFKLECIDLIILGKYMGVWYLRRESVILGEKLLIS